MSAEIDPTPHRPVLPGATRPARRGSVADRRGLTAVGAIVLAAAVAAAGAAFDLATGSSLRTAFAICFVLGCGLAAVTAHREDLRTVVLLPPLLILACQLVANVVSTAGVTNSRLTARALEITSAVVLAAPVLLAATGLALLVALVRAVAGRRRRAT